MFGTTLNPYDPSKTCGGSSGGAGVAVALRMLPVASGTDHTGSLRNPGAFNNVFALRPAYGRVPADAPDVFNSGMSMVGPMARTVTDLALLLSVQAGYDARVPLSIREDPAQFAVPLKGDVKGKRIAWGGDLLARIMPFEAGVLELCRGALETFEQLGCSVEEAVPDFPIEQLFGKHAGAARLATRRDPHRSLQGSRQARTAERGGAIRGGDVPQAQRRRIVAVAATVRGAWYQAVRRFFESYDYFVLPSAQVFPFDAKTHWPAGDRRQENGDAYYRWMEVDGPGDHGWLSSGQCAGGLQRGGSAHGTADHGSEPCRARMPRACLRLRSGNPLGREATAADAELKAA